MEEVCVIKKSRTVEPRIAHLRRLYFFTSLLLLALLPIKAQNHDAGQSQVLGQTQVQDAGQIHDQDAGQIHDQDAGQTQVQDAGRAQNHDAGQSQVSAQIQNQGAEQIQDQGSAQTQNQKPPQEGAYRLVEHVELSLERSGQKDTVCKLKFLEDWLIDFHTNSILKQVVRWDSCCLEILRGIPSKKGNISFKNLSYEFNLLDPHLVASGNMAFPEPDSMDSFTREFHADLIDFISTLNKPRERYQLDQQLLSLIFREDWSINPVNLEISKKVRAITPVIWQRRQTDTGEPVNDAETGLPVYYKIELEEIPLRNP